MLLLLIGLCIFRLDLVQSDLQVIIDNIELEADEEYFEFCTASPCENDDMIPVFSFDCKIAKDLPTEGTMKAVLLQMINGEPTEPTGVDMDISLDQMVTDTVLIGPLLTAMNIPLEWPIKPTRMNIECYAAPMDNFPDFFPPAEYKFTFNIDTNGTDKHLFSLDIFLTLY